MSAPNNYIVITGKSDCYRWLYNLNDNLANLIFVEPEDNERINSLLDSLNISAVLIHLQSQDSNNVVISDDEISPGFSAVMTHLQSQDSANVVIANDVESNRLSADLAMIDDLLLTHPQLTVIGLVEVINQNALLPIMRAGVRDLIKIGAPEHETAAIIARHSKRSPEVVLNDKVELGHVTALLNARAEDGTPFLAIHLALEMQRLGPTLLIDLGVPHADILLMLGVTSKFSFVDVINNRTRLDSTLIQTGFAKHSSGLTLLAAQEAEGAEVDITSTETYLVLHTLKRHFKHIVINHSGLRDAELLKVVLSTAESTLFVVEQTVPSCKRNYDLLQSLRQIKASIPNPRVIVDRHHPDLIPTGENIAKSFDMPLMCVLPSCGHLRLLTVNTGESMFQHAPKSVYVVTVKDMVRRLVDRRIRPPRQKQNKFLSKIYEFLRIS